MAIKMVGVSDVKTKAVSFVMLLVMLIIVINLTPTFIDTVQSINTTAWNFTGSATAATMIGLLPLVVVICIFLVVVISLFEDML